MIMKKWPEEVPAKYRDNEALADSYKEGWELAAWLESTAFHKMLERAWYGGVSPDKDWHWDIWNESVREYCKRSSFDETRREIDFHAEGGWFSLTRYPEGGKFGPYPTREEAEADAEEGDRIVLLPSAAALWEAFDDGVYDAIAAGLAAYTDEDYAQYGASEDANDQPHAG
jgi:hypothetical protein